jgi:hypothetical protein
MKKPAHPHPRNARSAWTPCRRFFALCLVAGVFVAGCDDVPITTVSYQVEDVQTFATGVLGQGPMLVVVRGHAHDVPAADTEAAVLNALTGATQWIAEPRFTTHSEESASLSMRLVVVLNDRPPEPCLGDPSGGPPQPGGRVELTMTFCSGETVLSKVRGRIGRTDGLDDPRFARLIRQATVDLFVSGHAS